MPVTATLTSLKDVVPGSIVRLKTGEVIEVESVTVHNGHAFFSWSAIEGAAPSGELPLFEGVRRQSGSPDSVVVVLRPGAKRIKCGHCSNFSTAVYHASVAAVRACAERGRAGHPTIEPTATVVREELRHYSDGDSIAVIREPAPEPARRERPESIRLRGELIDGYYTIVFEDGERRTIRVTTQPSDASFKPGRQLLSYLAGPDNTSSYVTFGDINRVFANIWKRFQGAERLDEAVRVLVRDPKAATLAYGMESGHCGVCGRLLTTPESIERGIGPVCARKMGW